MGTEIDNDSALFERGNKSRYFATLATHKFRYEFSDDIFMQCHKWEVILNSPHFSISPT